MNMQKLMQEAQKMQSKLLKEQEELEKTNYEGDSSLVHVVVNGKKDIVSVKLKLDEDFSKDEMTYYWWCVLEQSIDVIEYDEIDWNVVVVVVIVRLRC